MVSSKYQTQPLLKLKPERRYALLVAHLFELSQDVTDQALDQLDKLLTELMRKGERRQEKHFRVNARALNSHLVVLTKAAEAFLQARADGGEPCSPGYRSHICKQRLRQPKACCARKIWIHLI